MSKTPSNANGLPRSGDRAPVKRVRGARSSARPAWLTAASISFAAALAALAAFWIVRSSTTRGARDTAHDSRGPQTAATARLADLPQVAAAPRTAEPESAARDSSDAALARQQWGAAERRARFRAVSDALLQLDPSLAPGHPPELDASGRDARVWTIPDPVETGTIYRIGIAASCACTALLFSVSETSGEIALLFPNPYQPNSALQPNRPVELPSNPEWTLRAEGGSGVDVLKLVLLAEPIAFPSDRSRAWVATADRPDRIEELDALLAAIEPGAGMAAATPLRIVAGATRE
jgi:hypothetical protein